MAILRSAWNVSRKGGNFVRKNIAIFSLSIAFILGIPFKWVQYKGGRSNGVPSDLYGFTTSLLLNYPYRWMKLINTLTYFEKYFTIGLNN